MLSWHRLVVALTVLATVSLSACMTTQALDLRQQPPKSVELVAVPFYAQRDFECGPAALAMVMSYLGQVTTPDALAPSLFIPGRKGSLPVELMAQARERGFVPEKLNPDLRAIATAVAEGSPVIVMQNNGLSWHPLWHFAVVIGVDAEHGKVILRSGESQRLVLTWSVLDRTWARSGKWAIRLLPVASQWPASVSAEAVIPQLLVMAKLKPELAQQGLRQATSRWPLEAAAWLALAQVDEGINGLPQAEKTLRTGLQALPRQPALLNNLADLLRRSGRLQEALPFAKQALSIDDRPEIRDTLQAIEQAL